MPTTSYTDAVISVRGIGDRTDSAGVDVDDITAEEDRLAHAILTQGALTPDAFLVQAQSSPDMTVKVGSGSAKTDRYVIEGTYAGQENYIVRLGPASVNVTISAAEPASSRTDEIYLVLLDAPYDGNTLGTASAPLSLARIAYRKGDPGGAAPGPDALWDAYAKRATIDVGAAVTEITDADITNENAVAGFVENLGPTKIGTYTGDGTTRTIPLPFTPNKVEVYRESDLSGDEPLLYMSTHGLSGSTGVAFQSVDSPTSELQVILNTSVNPVAGGFTVTGLANENTVSYSYCAFR